MKDYIITIITTVVSAVTSAFITHFVTKKKLMLGHKRLNYEKKKETFLNLLSLESGLNENLGLDSSISLFQSILNQAILLANFETAEKLTALYSMLTTATSKDCPTIANELKQIKLLLNTELANDFHKLYSKSKNKRANTSN